MLGKLLFQSTAKLTVSAALGVCVAVITVAAASPASAARQVCSERTKFVEQLAVTYAENTVGLGLVNDGSVLEVLVSHNGTWTILVTKPNGISCVVATGEAWEKLPAQMVREPAA